MTAGDGARTTEAHQQVCTSREPTGHDGHLADVAFREFMDAWRGIRYGAEIDSLRTLIYARAELPLEARAAHALEVIVASGGCRLRHVTQSLHVDASTATRVCDRLEELGLVGRQPDPDDGRGVLVAPTDEGLRWQASLEARSREIMHRVLRDFEIYEQLALASYLRRIIASAGEVADGIDGCADGEAPHPGSL